MDQQARNLKALSSLREVTLLPVVSVFICCKGTFPRWSGYLFLMKPGSISESKVPGVVNKLCFMYIREHAHGIFTVSDKTHSMTCSIIPA